jgi:hypothetical protein
LERAQKFGGEAGAAGEFGEVQCEGRAREVRIKKEELRGRKA